MIETFQVIKCNGKDIFNPIMELCLKYIYKLGCIADNGLEMSNDPVKVRYLIYYVKSMGLRYNEREQQTHNENMTLM